MKTNSLLITKHKKSKNKKQRKQGSVIGEKKVQYYVLTHHKIKTQLSNGQYKNVFDLLFDMQPPEKSYIPLFYQDQLFAVNKLLKYHILRKELNSQSIGICFKKGKQVIPKLYDLFVTEQSLQWSLKAVNENMNKQLGRFLTILTYFIMECAYIRYKQEKMVQAMLLFSILFNLSQKIVNSATSDRKLLRKVSQALLLYASFLININDLKKAVQSLMLALKNESNILLTLACRLKTTSKSVYRRNMSESYSRLFAIFFNLSYIYQTKKQVRLSFMFLNQCKQISQLKMKILGKDLNPNFVEFFQNCQKIYTQYQEVTTIAHSYFPQSQLRNDIMIPNYHRLRHSQDSELLEAPIGTTVKISSVQLKLPKSPTNKKRVLKKSVSIKDKLNNSEEQKHYKNFGHQFLFYGVKLFEKFNPSEKKRNMSYTNLSKNSYSQTHEQIMTTNEHNKSNVVMHYNKAKPSSTLKKKTKKNIFFRQIQEPIEYDEMKRRFTKILKEDQVQVHKTHEQICLLSYKSHNTNFGGLHKQHKSAHEQIKFMNRRPETRISSKPSKTQFKDVIKETGCNLFKRILIMKSKVLGIKKTQTLNILKRKTTTICLKVQEGYSSPLSSVDFIKGQLQVRQQRYTASKIESKIDDVAEYVGKSMAIERNFLTKDTVQIPNLFLSYIARSTVSAQFLEIILQYGLWMLKNTYFQYK